MIWFREYRVEELPALMTTENMLSHIGLEFTEIGPDFVKARIPVDRRTHQIYGILHGGATAMLAETVGSFASLMAIDLDRCTAVGSVITANHIRPVSEGYATATCRPVHLGKSKHVWDILVHADNGKLVAKCELTCAIMPKERRGDASA